jgi:hypothetical protein
MALTKPRAYQIYDIDYKQATRVITVANVTLSGGAPSQVDGVNLSLNDRVLVIGQSNAAQNGIYDVDTVGSGSNGTWVRSGDTNSTGELLAGTIVMVTEGSIYADTQWKLTTDDPITIGVSELIFEQNSAFAFGNVYANGTAVLASSVGDVLTLSAGNNISITGNNTSKTVTIGVTGISLNSISNGTSNVNVVSSGGNVTVGIGGTSNVAVFGSTGANITGTLGVSGNVTGGNLTTAGTANVSTLIATTLVNATATTDSTSTTTGAIRTQGGVGVAGNVHVGGALVAVTKSFAVKHPTKQHMILYHGCLEGPEHAVYTRGRCTTNTIVLPDYWKNLVDIESITVHLTPMSQTQLPSIKDIYCDRIELEGVGMIDCFYLVHATRRDVPRLEIEVHGSIQDLYRDRNM